MFIATLLLMKSNAEIGRFLCEAGWRSPMAWRALKALQRRGVRALIRAWPTRVDRSVPSSGDLR